MAAYGRLELFFGLILPHGLLELTAVVRRRAGAGLKLFWAWVDPGPVPRMQALAVEGRSMITVALGLIGVPRGLRGDRGVRHAVRPAARGRASRSA